MKRHILDALLAAKAARTPAALVTDTATGAQVLVTPDADEGDLTLSPDERTAVRARMNGDAGGVLEAEPGADARPLFVDVHAPPPRLVVVGAVHIAQHLVPMAVMTGYDVVVVDPREAFASPGRFSGVTLTHDWPDEALEAMNLDDRTAVVTLTHDPKLDDPALHVALRSPVFYVGSLGSRKTHGQRVGRLERHGFSDAEIGRIHAPVGLNIGARSPAEIALSILAQVTAVRRGTTP
ncbi:Carbon monoxide dehydrogenase F protein [Caenispirillum salinarum AK4]|uniref:Carbon monoxide dehydrogenase F protein n=1 Tax=Caenispirillum salinarum AK4 TaxID=1238182 RepID=K9H3Y2_9PROT|nr:XdhC family protein [Caenispirillum salinarum]EKV31759.1 Carbon monoxide dehydrogenase F protein [Caenispirillum salinarum AK4]